MGRRLEIFKATFQSEKIMKAIIILSFVTMAYATGCAYAHPGGYLAKGGVVDFKRPLDYMKDAVEAGKKVGIKNSQMNYKDQNQTEISKEILRHIFLPFS